MADGGAGLFFILFFVVLIGGAIWLTVTMARHRDRAVWFWILMLCIFGPIAWLVPFAAGPRDVPVGKEDQAC